MSKKKIICICSVVLLLFLINIIVLIKNVYKPDNYISELKTTEQKELVSDILDNLSFSDEIKKNISARDLYDEFTDIPNHNYKNTLFKFINKTNDLLVVNNSSFIEEYKKGNSFSDILNEYCDDNYKYFNTGYLLGDEKNSEFSKENNQSIYIELLKKISNNDYDAAINEIDVILQKYKFTESYNENLANLYHDANMLNTDSNLSDTEILNNIDDIGVYTILTMKLYAQDRINIITDISSPLIYVSNKIIITDMDTISVSNKKHYQGIDKKMYDYYLGNSIGETLNVIKFTFNVDEETFYAYVTKTDTDDCKFYSVQPKNLNKSYQSIFDVVQKEKLSKLEDY